MPKVLIVIARLNVGGTSQYINELVQGLKLSKYEVLVATGHVQGAEREDVVVSGLPIRRVESMGRKISLTKDWKARRELQQIITDFEPDLIYSHTFKAGLLLRTIRDSIPRVHAFHGHLLSEPELQGFKSKVVVLIERVLAKRSTALVTVGERVAVDLLREKVGKAKQYRSIAPGVNELELSEKSIARDSLGIADESRPIVVWMARVTAVKAPQRVIEIAKAIPEARFLLAGGGDLLEEIKRSAPDNLTVLGWQSAKDMWAVADLAISTSENEGMPVALIEAQLAGVPVIAIDVGSVGEVIIDGKTGYIFDQFDSRFIAKLKNLLSDNSELERLGNRAKTRAKQEFSPAKMVNSHLKLFDEILAR